MLVGPQFRGPPLGVGDRPFIVAVRLPYQGMMATIGEVVVWRCVVDHVRAPFLDPAGLFCPASLQGDVRAGHAVAKHAISGGAGGGGPAPAPTDPTACLLVRPPVRPVKVLAAEMLRRRPRWFPPSTVG